MTMTRTDISRLARAALRQIRRATKRGGSPGPVAWAWTDTAIRVATARHKISLSPSSAVTPFRAWEFREGMEALSARPEAQLAAVVATLQRH
jgi:hypothetical protein